MLPKIRGGSGVRGGGDTSIAGRFLEIVPTPAPRRAFSISPAPLAFIWIAILTLLISRRIYTIILRLNPKAKMVRFTQLRWSTIFSETASRILTAVLQHLGLDSSLATSFKVSLSEALDPHVNRRCFTEEWWA